jgi:hypothetical protein
MSYRTLDAAQIVTTLQQLEARIRERFPASGLAKVCHDLVAIAETTQQRSQMIAAPNLALRAAIVAALAAGIAGLVYVGVSIKVQVAGTTEIFGIFQGVEAAMNIVVLVGAALFFLITLETRIKRHRALTDLHMFRSITHIIDMHQLTKDPSFVLGRGAPTVASPKRTMTRFELTRYLDYCSEMLSLTNKLAALYAQNLPDAVVIDAVNDIEQLTTNLSSKIWQKITILEAHEPAVPSTEVRPPKPSERP